MILENINAATLLALLGWPLVAFCLYKIRPAGEATLWTILGGYLLLPSSAYIKFEAIPAFDKMTIPTTAAAIGCMSVLLRPIRTNKGFGLEEILMMLFVISPCITSVLNDDPLVFEGRVLPGVGLYDGGSASLAQFITLVPFLIGRKLLRNSSDTEDIFRVLVIAGLAYSLLLLLEIRIGPQLNFLVYGSVIRDFVQSIRDGGFRPVVFLDHGLHAAFFTMTTVVAAAALWRMQSRFIRFSLAGVTGYLGVVLLLCKTAGAIVYAAVLVPLVRLAKPRLQIRVATILVVLALAYPILRTADLVPTSLMVEASSTISAERAQSLGERFTNERFLLDRALERLWFGWGRYGRSRVHDSYGNDTVNPDGYWIILLGQFGIFGFLATFSLLGLTVFRAASAFKSAKSVGDRISLGTLSLIVAIYMVNMLPNSGLFPWTWLLAGALLGRAEALYTVARPAATVQSTNLRMGRPVS